MTPCPARHSPTGRRSAGNPPPLFPCRAWPPTERTGQILSSPSPAVSVSTRRFRDPFRAALPPFRPLRIRVKGGRDGPGHVRTGHSAPPSSYTVRPIPLFHICMTARMSRQREAVLALAMATARRNARGGVSCAALIAYDEQSL